MSRDRRNSKGDSYDDSRKMRGREADIYIDGNTVRKLEPQRVWEEEPEEEPKKKPAQPPKHHHEIRKNRDKARYMNAGYVLFLAIALCAAAFILVNYVQLQAQLTTLTKTVAASESKLNRMKVSNDEEYNRILSSINLDEIKRIAITELGMVYAQEGQIVEYENESGDYMRRVKPDNQ